MKVQCVTSTPAERWVQLPASQAAQGTANLTLTDRRGQSWQGFGGCFNELGWIALSALPETDREAVIDALFDPQDGCRFNICRLPIGASDYAAQWYSHNEVDGDFAMEHHSIERDRKYLIPYIRRALERRPDIEFFASPWSPPTWMKFPRAYNYGTMIWQPDVLDAYALYFVKFVQAYQTEGINIRQVHVQNEPVADQKFPSCLWTGRQMGDFIRDHLGPAFETHNLDCEIHLGTLNTDDYDGFVNTVLSDAGARKYVAGVGFQWAGKGAVQRTWESYPDVQLTQTENECGDGQNTWDYATYVHGLLRHYIDNGINAYVYWNMVLQAGGLSTWGWRQNSMVSVDMDTAAVTYNPEFHLMKHFSRFVDPGATRLFLAGQWTGNATAFENPDGSIVLVINNPFTDPRPLRLECKSGLVNVELPAESFTTMTIQ